MSIQKIRQGTHGVSTRLVIELGDRADFRAFTMGDPWRVVLDLPPARWKTSKAGQLSGNLLKSYRSGTLADGLTRIVFDLRKPAVISDVFFLPKTSTARNRVVVDIAPASQNAFSANEKKVFGAADLRTGAQAPAPAVSQIAAAENNLVRSIPTPGTAQDDARTAGGGSKTAVPQRKPGTFEKQDKYTVVIDAGHGGDDPGALGHGGVREKHITLAVARELKRQMEETGRYRVVMTRDRDVYIKLHERVDMSRRVQADLFVSVHADKIERAGVQGASIYTLSSNASDVETERLAEQENNAGVVAGVDLSGESHDVAGILLDLAMREKMNESSLLARFIETAFRGENIRLLPNSHRSAGFAVLKAPDVPAVLIETGFLSNPQESKLLSSPQFQRKIATAMLSGIDAYFRKIEALQKL